METISEIPDEYQTGSVEFFGRNFIVTPDVLIPRLESETLVREALKIARKYAISQCIDFGTGSGIIGLSLLAEVPHMQGILVDISPAALDVARRNSVSLGLSDRCEIVQSDLWTSVRSQKIESTLPLLIVGNLPYIAESEAPLMSDDTAHEPALALWGGGQDGFDLIERWIVGAYNYMGALRTSAQAVIVWEMGFAQAPHVRAIAERLCLKEPTIIQDYAGHDRVFILTLWTEV